MTIKQTLWVFLLAVLIGAYLFVYMPYEKKISYAQEVSCSQLVEKYWSDQTDDSKYSSGDGAFYAPPYSHFNHKLNTCLADTRITTEDSDSSISTTEVVDVVSRKTLIDSTTAFNVELDGSTFTSTIDGLSQQDFDKQEKTLMSE